MVWACSDWRLSQCASLGGCQGGLQAGSERPVSVLPSLSGHCSHRCAFFPVLTVGFTVFLNKYFLQPPLSSSLLSTCCVSGPPAPRPQVWGLRGMEEYASASCPGPSPVYLPHVSAQHSASCPGLSDGFGSRGKSYLFSPL